MRKYSKFDSVKMSSITVNGWIESFLKGAAEGMVGNLDKIGYPYDKPCWEYRTLEDGGYEKWWPYEQCAYWVDSVVRTFAYLKDKTIPDTAARQLEAAMANDGDAFIGPLELKDDIGNHRWPHAVYFRALYAMWSSTGNERGLTAMVMHYKEDSHSYKSARDLVNIEVMLKLYEHFDDEFFLKKAVECFEKFQKQSGHMCVETLLSDVIPAIHGVTYNEVAKLPAILYTYTGNEKYLSASINAYRKLEKYHMLPDGVNSSSESTCGNESYRTHESCDISDYTWSLGYLLEATGDGVYADKIEWAVFNALPGAVGPYFRTIQYLSCVNQVICTRNSTHVSAWKNTPRMAYQPHHYPECCVGNIGRAMPNYVSRMYHKTDDGLAVSLYGDSVYDDGNVIISQSGNYPFGNSVKLNVSLKTMDELVLKLRIPSWSVSTTLYMNGKRENLCMVNGYAVTRVSDKDIIEITFSKNFCANSSADGGIYYTYGPFLMSLKISENITRDIQEPRQTDEFPALSITPASDWNYCVTGWEQAEIIKNEITENPFWKGYPLEIKVRARKLNNWELKTEKQKIMEPVDGEGINDKQILCGATLIDEELILTPRLPSSEFIERNLGKEEEITLVPYGCTNLRLTVFPKYLKEQ